VMSAPFGMLTSLVGSGLLSFCFTNDANDACSVTGTTTTRCSHPRKQSRWDALSLPRCVGVHPDNHGIGHLSLSPSVLPAPPPPVSFIFIWSARNNGIF